MGHFGQLSCKRHVGFSNARSFLESITARGGFLTNEQRELMTKHVLAKQNQNRSRFGKRTFSGVKKNLKQSQTLDKISHWLELSHCCAQKLSLGFCRTLWKSDLRTYPRKFGLTIADYWRMHTDVDPGLHLA